MRSALLSIAVIGLATAMPASANDNTMSVKVTMSDLDLSRSADAKQLRARLDRAARKVCVVPGSRSLIEYAAFNACRTAALSEANLKAERAIAAATTGSGQVRTARR